MKKSHSFYVRESFFEVEVVEQLQQQRQQQRCSSTNKIQKENLLRQDQIFGKETSLKRISFNLSFMQEVQLNLGKSNKMIIFGSLLTTFQVRDINLDAGCVISINWFESKTETLSQDYENLEND